VKTAQPRRAGRLDPSGLLPKNWSQRTEPWWEIIYPWTFLSKLSSKLGSSTSWRRAYLKNFWFTQPA
jgi:hypothetical protein